MSYYDELQKIDSYFYKVYDLFVKQKNKIQRSHIEDYMEFRVTRPSNDITHPWGAGQ